MNAPTTKTVLIVDDDPDIRHALADVLEHHGFAIDGAADGEEALAKLRAGLRPVFIILDLMMPGMDGADFRAAQLADAVLAQIPVILMTGGGDVASKALSLRAAGYLTKPFELHDIVDVLKRLEEALAAPRDGSRG